MQVSTSEKTRLSQTAVFRVALLLVLIVGIFLIARKVSMPKSFGQFGFFRGDNITEWTTFKQSFASGNQACVKCHPEISALSEQDVHAALDCQVCHEGLQAHVLRPNDPVQKIVGNSELCGSCHRELIGRSTVLIPTVKVGEHSGGLDCSKCHDSHQPRATIKG